MRPVGKIRAAIEDAILEAVSWGKAACVGVAFRRRWRGKDDSGKEGGGSLLVIAYMSIGEAENYRYYWQEEWEGNPPSWLAEKNPDFPDNYKVR